jgi:hypothetical protein
MLSTKKFHEFPLFCTKDGAVVETHKDNKVTKMVGKTEITDYLPAKEDALEKITKFPDGVTVQTFTDGWCVSCFFGCFPLCVISCMCG